MRKLKTKEQVFTWMFDRFKEEGVPSEVPGMMSFFAESIGESLGVNGYVAEACYDWEMLLACGYYGEDVNPYAPLGRILISGELAILGFELCLWFVKNGKHARLGYAELFQLMLTTHNDLGGCALEVGDRTARVMLSKSDGARWKTHFDVEFDLPDEPLAEAS